MTDLMTKQSTFNKEIKRICRELNVVFLTQWGWLVDRDTGEAISLSMRCGGDDNAQPR